MFFVILSSLMKVVQKSTISIRLVIFICLENSIRSSSNILPRILPFARIVGGNVFKFCANSLRTFSCISAAMRTAIKHTYHIGEKHLPDNFPSFANLAKSNRASFLTFAGRSSKDAKSPRNKLVNTCVMIIFLEKSNRHGNQCFQKDLLAIIHSAEILYDFIQ